MISYSLIMKNVIIYLIIILSTFSCKLFKDDSPIFGYSKTIAKKTIKDIFGNEDNVFEKDSIYLSTIILKEKAEKILGRRISNFATKEGEIYLKTTKEELKLTWQVFEKDSTKRKILLTYLKSGI